MRLLFVLMSKRQTIIITCCAGALLSFATVSFSASTPDDRHALWEDIDYEGAPWVENVSSQANINKGLQGRHIALWASHVIISAMRCPQSDVGISWQIL